MTERGRQRLLRVAGAVAVAAGTHQLAAGVHGVRGRAPGVVDPSVDSELRFYAAWYAGAGALMLRAAGDRELSRAVTPALGACWLAAAGGRLLSLRQSGRPHPLFLGLTALELVVAAGLLRRPRS